MSVRDFLKKHVLTCVALVFFAVLGVMGTISVLQSRSYEYHIYEPGDQTREIYLEMKGDPIVKLQDIDSKAKETVLTLKALHPGEGYLEIHYAVTDGGETREVTEMTYIIVSKTGLLFVNGAYFDYAGFKSFYLGLTIFAGLMAAYFIWLRREKQKDHYYSFDTIAYCAAALLFLIVFLIYMAAGVAALILPRVQTAKLLILITRNLMLAYSVFTIPFMAVFAVSMAVSNIELIRHEGRRLTNMLGIGIAAVLAGGVAVNGILFAMDLRMGFRNTVIAITYAIYSAGFTIFQVLLTGSVITCLQAAYRKVPCNKDYIIILGCAIRQDGTLYPLIRGRVDRAIEFWNTQYEATGKRAVFVPSGGKGSDERISEAKAMENYLLEKGIPKDLILVEDRAETTHENMLFSRELIAARKTDAVIAFSTTNYHVFRSGFLAEEVGVIAEGIGARTKWYFWPNAMIREVIGVFVRQSWIQWLFTAGLILLAGLAAYAFRFIS